MSGALMLAGCFGAVSRAMGAAGADRSAAALADTVDRHYNALRSLRVHFVESYAGMGTERTETGELLLRKPGQMRWTYSKPAGKLFVLNGKWGWFYSPADTQVEQIPARQLDDLRSPLRFLLGHTQLSKELNGLSAVLDGDGYMLSGAPKGMEQRISRIALRVTPEGVIRSMQIEEVDGARTRFDFAGETPNAPATAADFDYHPPPGVPVIQGSPPI